MRRNKHIRTTYRFIFIMSFFFLCAFQVQKKEFEEYSVKAAFILNFTKFIDWQGSPIQNNKTFTIGVLGESPIYKKLIEATITKKINNSPFEVVKFSDPSNFPNCKILFVPAATSEHTVKACMSSPNFKNTLFITEKTGSLKDGSGINFLLVENRIKFEVNMSSLNKANLKVSSQLLKLAQKIEE